jgi:hypothetical protein
MNSLRLRGSAWQFASVFAAMCAGNSLGDDFAPPAYRGMPLTVHSEWAFEREQSLFGMVPDSFYAVAGDPGFSLYAGTNPWGSLPNLFMYNTAIWSWGHGPAGGNGWTLSGQGAASGSSDFFAINMQNWMTDKPQVDLRIQLTCDNGAPWVGYALAYTTGDSYSGQVGFWKYDERHYVADISFTPSAYSENIVFQVPRFGFIDSVVFDSIAIPGPGGLALVGCAVLGGSRLARRR